MSSLNKQSLKLAAALKNIPQQVLDEVRPALIQGAEEIADNMRALVPVDEGELQASIEVTRPGETTPAYAAGGGKRTAEENEALVTVGNPQVRTGHMVEFGTVKMEAQPFMLPGFRIAKPRVMRRIARAIGRGVKKAGAK